MPDAFFPHRGDGNGVALVGKPLSSVAIWTWIGSLVALAIWLAVALDVALIVSLVLIDFVHGNPHRTKSNAVFMMLVFTPLVGFLTICGMLITFSASQILLGCTLAALRHKAPTFGYIISLAVLPIASILSWYCFDYLTPSNLYIGGDDRPASTYFQHGLTLVRFAGMLALQASVWLASSIWLATADQRHQRRRLSMGALLLAVALGVWWGHHLATQQDSFL